MNYDDSMFVPPWSEWSNDFINAEKWDQFNDQTVFRHPCGHERLPPGIAERVKVWRRPNEIFGVDGLAVQPKEDKNDVHNLLAVNDGLIHVKIYRWILYHIVLYTSRFKNQWPQPWHPSSTVFSCCKAKVAWNKKSNSEYNPFGKYWLKLFFMGKFRMICVSDHLPISHDDSVLLPLCENSKVLWLPLLVKGLLRIYALAEKFEQFNTITCLTGWSCIRKNCRQVSKEDLWRSILSHNSSNPFTDMKISDSQLKKKKSAQHADCFTIKTTGGAPQCFRDKIISNYEANPPNSIITAFILSPAICKEKTNDSLNRYSQPVFLNGVKTLKNKPLPTWKKHRWTKWAVKNNMIKRHELGDLMKLVNIYAPCCTTLKPTCHLMEVLNEYKSQEDEMQYELDISYLKPFTTHVELYIKSLQSFPYVKSIVLQNEDTSLGSFVTSSTDNNYNNHVYLHFESAYCESLLFTLSVCKDYMIHEGYCVNEPASMTSHLNTVDNICPYVYVEKFFWYETANIHQTPLLYIRTRGTSNDVLKLEPGINFLRVWGELPAKYSLMVESTTDFSIYQTVQTVFEKLVDQPKSVTSFIMNIKQAFTQLFAVEPNTVDHGQKLQKLYSSFMPLSATNENELQTTERYPIVSKLVQRTVVECVMNNLLNDSLNIAEMYTELQELFQTKSIAGQEKILEMIEIYEKIEAEKLSASQQEEQNKHHEDVNKADNMNKKKSTAASRKSIKSQKSAHGKPSVSPATSSVVPSTKIVKNAMLKSLLDNTFEVIWDVLNSDKIDLDEYHFKNDLLKCSGYVFHIENTIKDIDPLLLLLFRLELNTHSTSELVPTVIQCSSKNNDIVNLMLIDNNSKLEVRPLDDVNTFLVKRTAKGYTLLGWSLEKKSDDKRNQYRLSFFGRPYQILHSCGIRNSNNNIPKLYNGVVCNTLHAPEFITINVKNRFLMPNNDHLLARVFLNVENPALYTVYCHLENIDHLPMEIRIVDKRNSSTVFASARVHGRTAIIPIVFLDPNNYDMQTNAIDNTEISTNVFVIEVLLIRNIQIENMVTHEPVSDYDWTISCSYDQKITDITLETDTTMSDFRFISSIPHQNVIITQLSKKSNAINDAVASDENDIIARPDFEQLMESMMMDKRKLLEREIADIDSAVTPVPSLIEEENEIKIITEQLADRQNNTVNAILKEDDANENHQVLMDKIFSQNIFKRPNTNTNTTHAKSTIGVRASRAQKKKV
ncbi:Peptidase C2, calpain, catalytic domain [Cinara cedri]|uniref:Peptidase C2, calpain, catalytic domain n=1 Tax=Cinara cedri TaxID=506608 RepID=A0A5E4NSP1_9HEMI|nr:Peptidase C2, calpain, catalytic domain [Cinara cedri]